ETNSFSNSLTKFIRTIVAEEIRALFSTISDQEKRSMQSWPLFHLDPDLLLFIMMI
ncbi:hypothetical protein HN51_001059, partial [Arachis hypogaea]